MKLQHTCSAVSLSLFLSRPLFEFHLAEVQHGARTTIQTHLLLIGETEHSETVLCCTTSNSLAYVNAAVLVLFLRRACRGTRLGAIYKFYFTYLHKIKELDNTAFRIALPRNCGTSKTCTAGKKSKATDTCRNAVKNCT